MQKIEKISIGGRMAYLLCSFENLLLYYKCDKTEWKMVLEKLWAYTKIQYLDDWMYEIAEYMPNSVLEDTMEGAEYITEKEFLFNRPGGRFRRTSVHADVFFYVQDSTRSGAPAGRIGGMFAKMMQ